MPQGSDPIQYGLPAEAVEDVSARAGRAKHFRHPDGSRTAVLGAAPLHYQAVAGGPWLDPSEMVVQRSAPGTWTVTTSEISIQANYSAMTLTYLPTNQSWQWVFQGASVGPAGEIVYNGVPWQYEPSPWGVKSHVVVSQRRGPQTYQWIYTTNTTPVVDAEGNIRTERFLIPRPFVLGADGERYECGGWELAWPYARFSFDDGDLPDVALPYVIDPSTDILSGSVGMVYSQSSTYSTARSGGTLTATAGTLFVGQTRSGASYRCYETFLAFDLSGIPGDATVTGATLKTTISLGGAGTAFTMEARADAWGPSLMTGDWVSGADLSSLTLLASLSTDNAVDYNVGYSAFASEAALVTATSGAIGATLEMVLSSSRHRGNNLPSGSEYVQILASSGYQPTLTVAYTEVGSLSGGDALTVGITESGTGSATGDGADTATAGVADTGTGTATGDGTDALRLGIVESGDLSIVQDLASADALTTALAESGNLDVTVATDDTLSVSVHDAGGFAGQWVGTSDAATLRVSDGGDGAATGEGTDQATMGVTEQGTATVSSVGGDAASVAAAEASAGTGTGEGADSAAVGISESRTLRIIEIAAQHRLAASVHDAAGNVLGVGPLVDLLSADYRLALDEIGELRVSVPVTSPLAPEIVPGHELRLIREGEGQLYRAVIDEVQAVVDTSGGVTLDVRASSTARQMVWANTLLGRAFDGASLTSTIDTLLTGTGWTRGTVGSPANTVSARFEGTSVWAALLKLAETYGWHVVEDNLARTIDLVPAGDASGLVLANIEQAVPDMAVLPITELKLTSGQSELWNRVIPVGEGEGINRLTLQYSDRSSPYTIQHATGPDGQTYWYLEDGASISAHGARTQVLAVKDAVPLSNSPAAIRDAANALYDVAAAWLGWHSTVQQTYEVGIVGLTHRDPESGDWRIRPGQTVWLRYRGLVEDEQGRRLWQSIDDDLYVLGFERSFDVSGSDSWRLTVSTVDAAQASDAGVIAKAIESLWAVQTALKPVTFLMPFGPSRQSVDSGTPMPFAFELGSNVRYLHRADLVLVKRRVRTNATGTASQPQTTSSAGTSHTHTISGQTAQSGGGTTSSAGSAHSHGISGMTTQSDGAPHMHQVGSTLGTPVTWGDPSYIQTVYFFDSDGNSFGFYAGRGSTSPSGAGLWTSGYTTHTHGISGTTTQSEAAHTHTVPDHTHTVSGSTSSAESSHTHTVPAHSHSLSYGIYEGPAANAPQFRVVINGTDRTSALGGPWNGDTSLDVTQYLVDGNGFPLQSRNTVEIQSSQLCDVELSVRALVTVSQLVPV